MSEKKRKSPRRVSPSTPAEGGDFDWQEAQKQAVANFQAGRLAEAAEVFREIARRRPDDASAHFNLALALEAQGLPAEAADADRRAIEVRPDYAEARYHLGRLLIGQENPQAAITELERAAALQPDWPDPQLAIADALWAQGENSEAVARLRGALERWPDHGDASYNLGNFLMAQGELAAAAGCFERAAALLPDFPGALNNLGVVRKKQGRAGEAIEHYERALGLDPEAAEVHNNLGLALKETVQLEAAVARFEQALALQPGYPDALWNLALAREEMGQTEAAEKGYRAFLAATPTDGARIRLATLLPVIYPSLEDLGAHRRRLEEEVDRLHRAGVSLRDPAEEAPYTSFYLAYQGMDDREIQKKIADLYAPSARKEMALSPPSSRGEKIKVGFISKHLFGHTIGHYMRGFIANLDRERFEVSVFSLGDYQDPTGGYIRERADVFHLLPPVLEKARKMVAGCGLDVLYYPDIGMDPFTYYLAFTRLAHVQCVSFGHPVTTGIDAVDYFVSSETAEPDGAEAHYTEKLVRLKNFPTFYYRPSEPPEKMDRARLGLPAGAHIYLCPQSLFKLRPDFDEILGEILRGDPRGRVLFLEGSHAHLREMFMARFEAAFPDAADRVMFVPKMGWEKFLSLLAGADVILDTLHFSGGRTSLEALAYGTPIVTLPSDFMRGRVTYAFYRQMGLMDCVADTPEGYVAAALRLGRDEDARQEMRGKILAANHVLYENKETLRQFEDFLAGAVEKVRAG